MDADWLPPAPRDVNPDGAAAELARGVLAFAPTGADAPREVEGMGALVCSLSFAIFLSNLSTCSLSTASYAQQRQAQAIRRVTSVGSERQAAAQWVQTVSSASFLCLSYFRTSSFASLLCLSYFASFAATSVSACDGAARSGAAARAPLPAVSFAFAFADSVPVAVAFSSFRVGCDGTAAGRWTVGVALCAAVAALLCSCVGGGFVLPDTDSLLRVASWSSLAPAAKQKRDRQPHASRCGAVGVPCDCLR